MREKVITFLTKNIRREVTISDIKKELNSKSNSLIPNIIKKLVKENIIISRKIANTSLLQLNLNNNSIFCEIEYINRRNLPILVKKSINILENELDMNISYYSIVIFGSYAIGKQRNDSDLDILILTQEKKGANIAKTNVELQSPITPEIYIFTIKEFEEMITNNEENLGKEILRKHLTIKDPSILYKIINKNDIIGNIFKTSKK